MSPWVSSIFAVVLTATALLVMARRSRVLVQATFALSFGFLWMLLNVIFIEISGGVYATEMLRTIGGGTAAIALAVYFALLILAILLVFSLARLGALRGAWQETSQAEGRLLGVDGFRIGRWILVFLTVAVYADLLRGPVPLLVGIDRGAYASIAGPVVQFVYRYEMYICLVAGVLYTNDVRNGLAPTRSLAGWSMAALIIAYVLMGHKFSGVFFNLLLFLVSASLLHWSGAGRHRLVTARRVIVVLLLGGLFTGTLLKYVSQFSSSAAVSFYLQQRLLIQQGELWWGAHDRIVEAKRYDPQAARGAVFVAPVVASGLYTSNTAVTYLMYLELGSSAVRIIRGGFLYTGASPTILLELFGVWGGAAVMFLVSLIYGTLLYLFLRAVALRNLLVSVLVCYVFGLFHNVVVGGNAAELFKGSLAIKAAAMILALIAATEWRRRQVAVFTDPPTGEHRAAT